MADRNLSSPLSFEPIFMERIWGGRKLAELFGKELPANKPIGESWEIVDRPEAQSVVANGPLAGKTLHELWSQHRKEIFGDVLEAPRFLSLPFDSDKIAALRFIVFGLLLMGIMMFRPQGLMGKREEMTLHR